MNQNGIDMQVCVEGRPIREFGCEGRTLVEGRKGVPFTIKVKNNHPKRVHVSVLVDGVGAVSGNAKDLRGYVLEAYSSYEIKGWRRSLSDVSSFVFETKDKSYTKAVKGSDAQCGVISLVAHVEKVKPQSPQIIEKHIHHDHHHHDYYWDHYWPHWRPYYPGIYASSLGMTGQAGANGPGGCDGVTLQASNFVSQTSTGPLKYPGVTTSAVDLSARSGDAQFTASMSMSGAENVSAVMNLGTGWGAQQLDAVNEVEWQDGAKIATMELYYTDAKGLKHLGIDVNKTPALPKTAHFPSGLTGTGFCQPPPMSFEYSGEPATPPAAKKQPIKARKKSTSKR